MSVLMVLVFVYACTWSIYIVYLLIRVLIGWGGTQSGN